MMKISVTPFFLLLSLMNFLSRTEATIHPDIISKTCQTTSEGDSFANFTLCVSSLSSVPTSHRSDIHSLAIISLKLAIANATHVESKWKKLFEAQSSDKYYKSCLKTCLYVYKDAIFSLKNSITAIKNGHYADADRLISGAVYHPQHCEDGFTDGYIKSPLWDEDYVVEQLIRVSLGLEMLLRASPAPAA